MVEHADRWTPTNHIVLGFTAAAAFVSAALGFAVAADDHLGWGDGFVAGIGLVLSVGSFLVARLVLTRQDSKSRRVSGPVAIAAALALAGSGLTVWQVTVIGDPPPPGQSLMSGMATIE